MRLVPLDIKSDRDELIRLLIPGFGGDREGAAGIVDMSIDYLERSPRPAPWGSYIGWHGDTAVALGSFKLAPDADGVVEIAYMTLPAFEGRGHARSVIAALVQIARDHGVTRVIAHTLPEENTSNRALRSNGFHYAGDHDDPEDGTVWRWERSAAA